MKKRVGITKRGIVWELANSIWIAATFVMMLGWAAFLYIGIRTKQRKWVAWGGFYLVISIGCIMLNGMEGIPDSVTSAAVLIYVASWLMCVIHAFLVRKEFLIRLEVLGDSRVRQQKNDMLRQRIRQEYAGESGGDITLPAEESDREATENVRQAMEKRRRHDALIQDGQSLSGQTGSDPDSGSDAERMPASGRPAQSESEAFTSGQSGQDGSGTSASEQPGQMKEETSGSGKTAQGESGVTASGMHSRTGESDMAGSEDWLQADETERIWDVNRCTAEELAELPGITLIMAKKAVAHRQESGEFSSVEDFLKFIALKPHFVVQIRDRLTCTLKSDPSGRKSEKTGRILDF